MMRQEQLATDPNYFDNNTVFNALPMSVRESYLSSNMPFSAARDAYFLAIDTYLTPVIPNFQELQNAYYAIGHGYLAELGADGTQLELGWQLKSNLRAQLLDPLGDW